MKTKQPRAPKNRLTSLSAKACKTARRQAEKVLTEALKRHTNKRRTPFFMTTMAALLILREGPIMWDEKTPLI